MTASNLCSSTSGSRFRVALISLAFLVALAAQAQIVAFGASNVLGYGVKPEQAFPAVLEGMLKTKGYHVSVINAGAVGSTTSDMLQRVDSAIPGGTKIVILDESGGYFNDTMKHISHAQGDADMNAIRSKLGARGIVIIPFASNKIADTYKLPDRIHLSPTGHQLVAHYLLPKVLSALGSTKS